MKELLEVGKVTPVIDRRFPLRDVADAIRFYHILDHAKRGRAAQWSDFQSQQASQTVLLFPKRANKHWYRVER